MTPHSQPVGAPERANTKEVMPRRIYMSSNCRFINNVSEKRITELDTEYALVHPMPQGIAEAVAIVRCGPEMWMNKATHCREEDWEGFQEKAYKIADILESSLQRLALMESQLPRVWTAETIVDAPEGQYWCFSPPYKKQKGYWNVFPFTINQETKWNVTEGVYPKVHGPLPVPPI